MKEKFIKIEKTLARLPETVINIFNDLKKEIAEAREKLKDIGDTNYKLGIYHLEKRNIKDAIFRFKIAMHFNKNSPLLHYHLARCYIFEKKIDKAKLELEKALALDNNFLEASYRRSIIEKAHNDVDIPIQIIKEDFNVKAQTYEIDMIQNLDYVAPQILATNISEVLKKKNYSLENLTCIDLGCGTGIAGTVLKNVVALKTLVGVDISSNMLELAKTLENNDSLSYTETVEADIHELELGQTKFDIIMSCLGFDYSGKVDLIFDRIKKFSSRNSLLAFVSIKSTEDVFFDYDLGSFGHNSAFWENLFKQYKWSVEHQEEIDVFNTDTKALLYILTKK